nr:zinc finger, CCHC-type [Tanacetum cinerariifolium]
MEILLEPTSNKLMVASDTLTDFQIKFSISIDETVTHLFTLIALSTLRCSDNKNTLSLMNLILRSILKDLQVTPTKPGRMTKPYSSHRFIANCFNAGNFKKEVKEGIDYFDTYAPVAYISTIRLLIALAATHNLVIHQMDVKTSFLNGDLEEEIYMKQPEGFVIPGNEHKVYMGEADVILGMRIKRENKGLTITQSHYIEKILKKFNCEGCRPVSTPMEADMGEVDVILGIRIKRENKGLTITQSHYIEKILKKFNCEGCRPEAIIRVFRYLKKTMNYGLSYVGFPSVIEGYSDASWITNSEDHTSTTGLVFLLGGALAAGGKEEQWLRNLIYEIPLWPKLISLIFIYFDSAATLAKAYSQIYNGKSRHLGVRHSMVRELIMNGVISVDYVRSQQNLADHLTKGLARDLMHKLAIGMGLKSI